MNIPDKAVEAVLDLVKARDAEGVIERDAEDYAAIAALIREDLEAAAPFMRAQADESLNGASRLEQGIADYKAGRVRSRDDFLDADFDTDA